MHETEQQGAEQQSKALGTVFLSYTRAERDQALAVIALLEQNGLQVWWDGLLEGGANYLPTTENALESADCVVVLWSKLSVDSHWVRDEAQRGRERGCLVPLGLDGTLPPLGFRQFQMIDISRWNGKGNAPEAALILRAVLSQCGADAAPNVRPSSSGRATRPTFSRRALIGGGAGLVGLAGIGAWRLGLFGRAGLGDNSVAVMPFDNLSGNKEQASFSDGLSSQLRAALARNPLLRVAAPSSSLSLRDSKTDDFAVAAKLGVAHVLRGSVQRGDDMLRVTVELLRVRDGLVRWAQTLDRKLQDLLTLQSEIAQTVAAALVTDVFGKIDAQRSIEQQREVGGTSNVAANEAYLRGMAFYDLSAGEESDRAALAQFDAAIAADPRYAAAHAMRSTMLAAIANAAADAGEVRKLYDAAIAAATHAIELAPNLARAHLAMGFALNNGNLDTRAARGHYAKARALGGGDADVMRAVATFNAFSDDPEVAAELIGRVLELDPLNSRAFRSAGNIAYARRDYGETIAQMTKALGLNPKLASANFGIGNAHYQQGNVQAALAAYRDEAGQVFGLTGEAIALARLGDKTGAKAAFDQLIAANGDSGLYQQAQVLAQWGDAEGAFGRLGHALELRDSGLLLAGTDPMLDPLRQDARFQHLLSALGS